MRYYSNSILFTITFLVLIVLIAGYAVRPFEKRAPKDSPIHMIKWILLSMLAFLVLLYFVYLPFIVIPILLFGLVSFFGMLGFNKLRGKKFQFTSVTISNAILSLAFGVFIFTLIIFIAWSGYDGG